MKKIELFLTALIACVVLMGSPSCAVDPDSPTDGGIEVGAAVTLDIQEAGSGVGLDYSLSVFRKQPSAADYVLYKNITLSEGTTYVTLPLSDVKGSDFKFVFLAGLSGAPDISLVRASDNASVSQGDAWADARLLSMTDSMTVENYCGIEDVNGDELIVSPNVHGTLKRVVGRAIYDIYRIDPSAKTPVSIADTVGNTSVLDRTYSVKFRYTGVTRRMAFAPDNSLVVDGVTDITDEMTITPGQNYRVLLPQADTAIVNHFKEAAGSARIYGQCMLPSSSEGIKVFMEFDYVDTTPVCGNTNHTHSRECFTDNTISLDMPQNGMKLPVAANNYTRTRIGIPCDRVIDIPRNGNLSIDYGWKD